ncbi:conserved hypothetical protein [Ricinus communis]|uniref:Uncharacterized protein n=1 Tax=Ricinus communis TaxID=3988 RepID=B9T192_RICCO|nr:conserved hypothetical protein [Ricinus communis]
MVWRATTISLPTMDMLHSCRMDVASFASFSLYNWSYAQHRQHLHVAAIVYNFGHGLICWNKPSSGHLKVNTDDAMFSSSSRTGFRMVVKG